MLTLDQIASLYGQPAEVRRRYRRNVGASRKEDIHRYMRRKVMAVAFVSGHDCQGIGDYMNCPGWVVEHHLNMYAIEMFGVEKYGMSVQELSQIFRRGTDEGLEALLGAKIGPQLAAPTLIGSTEQEPRAEP